MIIYTAELSFRKMMIHLGISGYPWGSAEVSVVFHPDWKKLPKSTCVTGKG